MNYLNIDSDHWIEYDLTTNHCRIVSKSQTEDELADAQTKLTAIPDEPTEEELLAWAQDNYPKMDYSKEIESLTQKITDNSIILDNLI